MDHYRIPTRPEAKIVLLHRFDRGMTLNRYALWLDVSTPTVHRIIQRRRVLELTLRKVLRKIKEYPYKEKSRT